MKLLATIQKDVRILLRDRMGLLLMFAMPVLLVVIVTSIQSVTFDTISQNKIEVFIHNNDNGRLSQEFIHALDTSGLFKILLLKNGGPQHIADEMHANDVVISIVIDSSFTNQIEAKAKVNAGKALVSFGLDGDAGVVALKSSDCLTLYYNPVIQQSIKLSIQSVLNSAVQIIQSKETLQDLSVAINDKPLPDSLQDQMFANDTRIKEIPLSSGQKKIILTATQHNVPAWTIFAMFFVVTSLGSSIVREKVSGSFIRLKTLPTNYFIALLSKQITYLCVTFIQATLIFLIGMYIFPFIDLPALHLPVDIAGLIIITLICGWCAVSYAMCVGVFAHTQDQANSFGAVSIVIFSIIGGLMVPSFIMPDSFRSMTAISPLHWCLQAYYGLFLEGGRLKDVGANILSVFLITIVLQAIALLQLKRKKLI